MFREISQNKYPLLWTLLGRDFATLEWLAGATLRAMDVVEEPQQFTAGPAYNGPEVLDAQQKQIAQDYEQFERDFEHDAT